MKSDPAFSLSLYATAAWGYLALLATGELSAPVVLFFLALIPACAALRKRRVLPPAYAVNAVTIAVFVGLGAYATRSLLDSTVYFFMYLQTVKLATRRTTTDAMWVCIITFFLVVASAVLTTSVGFALIFVGYLALMVLSLTLLTLARGEESARQITPKFQSRLFESLPKVDGIDANLRAVALPSQPGILSRGFVLFSVLLTVVILWVTVGVFMVIPRLSTQKLFQSIGGQRQQTRESVSAFDETIEFGTLEKINLDSRIALYVRPIDPGRPSHVRLRGVALDTFDGRRWIRTTRANARDRLPFEPFHRRSSQFLTRVYLMIQPPGVTNYLFGDNFPESLRLDMDQAISFDPLSNSVWLPMPLSKEFHYTVNSRVEDLETRRDPVLTMPESAGLDGVHGKPFGFLHDLPSEGPPPALAVLNPMAAAATLYFTSRQEKPREDSTPSSSLMRRFKLPDEYRRRCLRVPESLERARVLALAAEWTASARTAFEQGRAIESYFRRNYTYSLEPRASEKFIENFLFRTRLGHCEYFATSMVMMLRSLGIPSRIVNGYYCTEWNDIARSFTVRQRDAHSWVEAYFDDYGWMTFDPTPPAGVGRTTDEPYLAQMYGRVVDALKIRWYRYMIDYNYTDQIGVVRGVIRLSNQVRGLLERLSFQSGTGRSVVQGAFSVQVLTSLAALVVLSVATASWFALRRRGVGNGRHRKKRANTIVRFYAEVVRMLERHGFERRTGETPREFAAGLASSRPDFTPLGEITEIYYRTRYLGDPPSPEQERLVQDFVRRLREMRNEKS